MGKHCKKIYKEIKDKTVYFRNKDEDFHNLNGPAIISFYDNSLIHVKKMTYYINGLIHRNEEDGPAVIHFNTNGSVIYQIYYRNGMEYRRCGPAYIKYKDAGTVYMEWYC